MSVVTPKATVIATHWSAIREGLIESEEPFRGVFSEIRSINCRVDLRRTQLVRASTIQTAAGIRTPFEVRYFDNTSLTASTTLSASSGCSRSALPNGPIPRASFNVCSRSAPPTSASNGLIVTAPNPESASIERTRLELANANGPGAVGSGGATGGRSGSAACSGACIHGFSLRGRQQTKARRPSGFNDPRMLANAATERRRPARHG